MEKWVQEGAKNEDKWDDEKWDDEEWDDDDNFTDEEQYPNSRRGVNRDQCKLYIKGCTRHNVKYHLEVFAKYGTVLHYHFDINNNCAIVEYETPTTKYVKKCKINKDVENNQSFQNDKQGAIRKPKETSLPVKSDSDKKDVTWDDVRAQMLGEEVKYLFRCNNIILDYLRAKAQK